MKHVRLMLTAALALACVALVARAEEPKCSSCPATAACPKMAAAGGDAWLARLPMVGRLFQNAEVCAGPACCTDMFERIGVDFDFELCPPPPGFAHVLQFAGFGCPCEKYAGCPCGKVNREINVSHCAGESCAAKGCASGACNVEGCNVAACPEADCGCESCPARQTIRHFDHLITHEHHPLAEMAGLFERIVELSAEKAAAEAALEAREESHEQLGELLESMIELASENASLEAKLAAQGEHMKLAEKLIELAGENARLKAQVELADAKHDLLRDSLEVAVENERLKTRVAELEKQQATATAARPRAAKLSR